MKSPSNLTWLQGESYSEGPFPCSVIDFYLTAVGFDSECYAAWRTGFRTDACGGRLHQALAREELSGLSLGWRHDSQTVPYCSVFHPHLGL